MVKKIMFKLTTFTIVNYDFDQIKKQYMYTNTDVNFQIINFCEQRIQGLLLSMLQLSRMRGMPSSSLTWGEQDDKELTSLNWSYCIMLISESISYDKWIPEKIHY